MKLKKFKKIILIALALVLLAALVFGLWQLSRNTASAQLARKVAQAPQIKSTYKLDSLSLILPAKDENSMEIKLGEPNAKEFIPNLELTKWDGEVKMKIKPAFSSSPQMRGGQGGVLNKEITPSEISPSSEGERNTEGNLTFSGNKINYQTPNEDYRFYNIPPNEEHKEGAYEFEVILKEKPQSNVVSLDIETENLDFYYQGELSQKEKARKFSRPENVIGSYAAYYKDNKSGDYSQMGGKNYKTGKAFHIYRPKITDAKGNWVWGEFNKDLQTIKQLTITVPQEFLDKAVYPVIVDPTFGYTVVGASIGYDQINQMEGIESVTPAEASTITSLSVYFTDANEGSQNWKPVIALASSKTFIANGVGNGTAVPGSAGQWGTATFGTPPTVKGQTEYLLMGVYSANDADSNLWAYDNVTGYSNWFDASNDYTTPTDPTDAVENASNYIISSYATYTPAAIGGYRRLVASDNFNRASLGSDWAQLNSYNGEMGIYNSTVVTGGGAGIPQAAARWVGAGAFGDNQYSSIKIGSFAYQSQYYSIGVIVRASGDTVNDRDYYMALMYIDSGEPPYTTELIKVVDGDVTSLHSALVTWREGDRLELEAQGSTIRVLQNGAELNGFRVTDRSLRSGLPGIAGAAQGSNIPTGDDWEAGNLGNTTVGKSQTNFMNDDSLVGYWSFDGAAMNWASTTAEALDLSGNNNNGNVTNFGKEGARIGKVGQALSFDGVDDYADAGVISALDGVTRVSVAAWVKWGRSAGGMTSEKHIVEKSTCSGSSGVFELFGGYTTASKAEFVIYNGVGPDLSGASATSIDDNKWHYLVGTYDGNYVRIYVDGVDENRFASSDKTLGQGDVQNFQIGGECNGSGTIYNWPGLIDEVRVYNRALSASEIADLYRAGAAKMQVATPPGSGASGLGSDLVGYWSFNGQDMGTTSASDLSGNNNTAWLYNGPKKVIGKIGQALSFDGSNDSVQNTNTNTAFSSLSSLSVSVWVYPRSQGTSNWAQFVVSGTGQCHGTLGEGWAFGFDGYLGANSEVCFGVDYNTDDIAVVSNTNTMTMNEWQNVIVTWDGSATASNVHIYRNGQEVSYATQQNGTGGRVTATSPNRIYIGFEDSNVYFKGLIDEVRVYNRVLSASEIQQLYQQGSRSLKFRGF